MMRRSDFPARQVKAPSFLPLVGSRGPRAAEGVAKFVWGAGVGFLGMAGAFLEPSRVVALGCWVVGLLS